MKATAERKRQFCDLMVHGQSPETAAKAIGISRSTAYACRKADVAFDEQWRDAWDRKVEAVENVLYRMAIEKDIDAIKTFLRAHKPEIYNRRPIFEVINNTAIGINTPDAGEVVHFYLPDNKRGEPEELEGPDEATIEAETAA